MKVTLGAALICVLVVAALVIPGASAVAPVSLGRATPFAVLAGAGITNTGATTIVGDVGSHPTASMTGFDSVILTGENHGNDAVAGGAKDDFLAAYVAARDRTGGMPVGDLGGLTLVPGVYTDDNAPDSMALTGTLTLDGQNDPNAVFIFQSGSTLLLSANSIVVLVHGAQACNIFWQVTSSATLETGAHLEGTIMALASITLGTGASIHGAALATTGSVTMSSNQVLLDPCDSPATTTSSPTSSTSASTTSSPSQTTTSSPSQTTTSSPSQTTTSSPSQTTTSSPTQTTTSSPTQSETETQSPSLTTSDSQTPPPPPSGTTPPPGTTTSQGPTTEVPFFPSTIATVLAAVAAVGGALLVIRRRL